MLSVVRHAVCNSTRTNSVFQLTRAMSDGMRGVKGFSEHEIAVENRYFNKEDERLLRGLLDKVKVATETTDTVAAATSKAAEEAALHQIVGKYKMDRADFDSLIRWKHAHY